MLACFKHLAPRLEKELKAMTVPVAKFRYSEALLDLYSSEGNETKIDELKLRERVVAYKGGSNIDEQIRLKYVDDANIYRGDIESHQALINYFSQLGPDYNSDVEWARRELKWEKKRESGAPTLGDTLTALTTQSMQAVMAARSSQTAASSSAPSDSSSTTTGGVPGANSQASGPSSPSTSPLPVHNECLKIGNIEQITNPTSGKLSVFVHPANGCSAPIDIMVCFEHPSGGWACAEMYHLKPGAPSDKYNFVNGEDATGRYKFWVVFSEADLNRVSEFFKTVKPPNSIITGGIPWA